MVDQTRKEAATGANGRSTPPRRAVELTENARTVLTRRYLRKGPDGKPAETIEEMFWRVAWHVAAPEDEHKADRQAIAEQFFDLLTSRRFFPNSPTFTGAGTPLGQLSACFVLRIDDDMGRQESGIFQTLRDAALIQQTGGGNGFAFSSLRPKGARVKTSEGEATGPVGFLRVYDQAFGEIAQGGCLTPDTLVFTENGLLRLDEIVQRGTPGWADHDLVVMTDEGERRSTQAYNNGVTPVLRVTTDMGLEITGTPNHKLKVMTPDGPAWRALDDLQAGDSILVKLGQHRGKMQPLRKPKHTHGNQIVPQLPFVLDQEFAFFLGYLVGDGFVASSDRDHRVGVSVAHCNYLLAEMESLFHRLFGEQINVHKLQKDNDASVTVVVDNRLVKDFLVINGLAKNRSAHVRVPRLIRQSPPAIVGAFLRGLFEADGSLSHGYPSLMSSSNALIREVAVLLIGLGCPVRIRRQKTDQTHYGAAEMWSLRIHSARGLDAWRKWIGCDPRSRFAVCGTHQPDLGRETVYRLPHPEYWINPVLEATRLPQIDRQHRGQGRNFRATSPKLRRQLLRYTRGDRQLTLSGYTLLAEQHPDFAAHARPVDDLWFVKVKAVEPVGEALTLDLEVDENHTYLANGYISHNSRRGANMGVLRVDHPDIREFITCKTNESHITNFNISVGVTDRFMQAVKNDGKFDLVNPQDGKVWETVRAREIFDLMVRQAHHNGEPGILFLDAANRDNPVPHLYQLESTNPCFIGESRIATEFGLLRLDDLAESGIAGFVASDNRAPASHRGKPGSTQGVALRWASPAWMTRKGVPVMTMTTRSGYRVTATPDHRFLTPNGYVELRKLKAGDRVLIQSGEGAWSRNTVLPNMEHVREMVAILARSDSPDAAQAASVDLPVQWSHGLGFALGWLLGEGSLSASDHHITFSFPDSPALDRVRDVLTPWFGEGDLRERPTGTELVYGRIASAFFQALGAREVRPHETRLPDSLWTAPREAVIGFLHGLFGAHGTVETNEEKKDCIIRLSGASRGLMEDVQLLLSNFGIMSRIFVRHEPVARRTPSGRVQHGSPYGLMIGKSSRARFASEIGFASEDTQALLDGFIELNGKSTARDNFADTIVAVVDAGSADVYDLTQYQTHSLIVNGFVASNCGEQFLGPYENCCLGSVNLAEHVAADGSVDWDKLRHSVELSARFLDDVVDANTYVPAVPQLELAAKRVRRIGLGIMGLADLMYHQGVRYGSEEGQEFASQVMEFVHYHAMKTSVELSKERGPFLAIRGSLYDPDDLKWSPPQPLVPYRRDWGRPALDWQSIVGGIKQHGIRNGAQTTIAPTGTISTVAGCEGYGCEPVFALAYMRHFNDNGKDTVLQYTSPLFEQALINAGLDDSTRPRIVERVNLTGSCQDIPEVPERIRRTFVVASDITAEEHVRMQAAMQRFVSNAISKTCNFPPTAMPDDVAQAYMLAWGLGCKGLTVYVAGSRDKVVLETAETVQAKQSAKQESPTPAPAIPMPIIRPKAESEPPTLPLFKDEVKKPRGRMLSGYTYRVETPLGTTFVTINENGGEQPFEVFLHTSKAGSETAAISEALGRLISYILRMNANVEPRMRLIEVVRQLEGIGGGRSLGLGPKRVRSLPDGVAQVLREYLAQKEEAAAQLATGEVPEDDLAAEVVPEPPPGQMALPILKGDLCPECGEASVVNEEGCRKCHSCGFSEC